MYFNGCQWMKSVINMEVLTGCSSSEEFTSHSIIKKYNELNLKVYTYIIQELFIVLSFEGFSFGNNII